MLRLLQSPRNAPPNEDGAGEVDPLLSLVRAAVGGDTEAERTLLVTLGSSLLGAVRGVLGSAHPDVEDVLQEAMTAVHQALPGFRGECRATHFACRIAVQTAMNARRRAARRRHAPRLRPGGVGHMVRPPKALRPRPPGSP
jgi:DNA-directed RNA polymerase specialized sigma24 family protein